MSIAEIPFDFTPYLPLDSAVESTSESTETVLDEAIATWMQDKKLRSEERNDFRIHLKNVALSIVAELRAMERKGSPATTIRQQAQQSLQKLNDSAHSFLLKTTIYREADGNISDQLNAMDHKLDQCSLSFDSFSFGDESLENLGKKQVPNDITERLNKPATNAFKLTGNTSSLLAPKESTILILDRIIPAAKQVFKEQAQNITSWIDAIPPKDELIDKAYSLSSLLICFAIPGSAVLVASRLFLGATAWSVGARLALIPPTMLFSYSTLHDTRIRHYAASSNGNETVMYISPKYDHNGACHLPDSSILKIVKGRKLVVARIDSPNQLKKLIEQQQNISHIWINAHGNSESIVFERRSPEKLHIIYPYKLANILNQGHFTHRPEIILSSCCTGSGFAQDLYEELNHYDNLKDRFTITAPDSVLNTISTTVINDTVFFRAVFLGLRDQTVRVPTPTSIHTSHFLEEEARLYREHIITARLLSIPSKVAGFMLSKVASAAAYTFPETARTFKEFMSETASEIYWKYPAFFDGISETLETCAQNVSHRAQVLIEMGREFISNTMEASLAVALPPITTASAGVVKHCAHRVAHSARTSIGVCRDIASVYLESRPMPLTTLLDKHRLGHKWGKSFFRSSVYDELTLYKCAEASIGKETVVYIMPKLGCAPTHIFRVHDNVLKFSTGKKLVVARVDNPRAIARLLEQQNNISTVWITAHGSPEAISFSKTGLFSTSGSQLVKRWPIDKFIQNAKVILESCETGGVLPSGQPNVARQIAEGLKGRVKVYAPREMIGVLSTEQDHLVRPSILIGQNNSIRFLDFDNPWIDVTTVYSAIKKVKKTSSPPRFDNLQGHSVFFTETKAYRQTTLGPNTSRDLIDITTPINSPKLRSAPSTEAPSTTRVGIFHYESAVDPNRVMVIHAHLLDASAPHHAKASVPVIGRVFTLLKEYARAQEARELYILWDVMNPDVVRVAQKAQKTHGLTQISDRDCKKLLKRASHLLIESDYDQVAFKVVF